MDQKVGLRSLCYAEAPFLICSASVVGSKEGEGPLKNLFDKVGTDDFFGQDTWEEAESQLQKEAMSLLLYKSRRKPEDIRYLLYHRKEQCRGLLPGALLLLPHQPGFQIPD